MVKVRGDTMKKSVKKKTNNKTKKKQENKDNVSLYIFVVILVFMIALIALTVKGTRSTDTTEPVLDTVSIDCPEAAAKGSNIECEITLNVASITAKGISMKYSLADGMEFVSFTKGLLVSETTNTEDGAVLVNLNGLSGEVFVGTLEVKMPADAEPNSMQKVELVEMTIGDGADTVVELENASDEIRILSNINTLENLTLVDGTINETFDKNVKVYTSVTDADKITIEASKTDEKSALTGDVGVELELQYGTNTFDIVVTAEDGTENVYTLKVFRNFLFSSDKYLYNREKNYIYVGAELETMLENIRVPETFTKEVKEKKLIIGYNEEKLLEIDIIYVLFDDYEVTDNIVYVSGDFDKDTFIENAEYSEGIELVVDEEVNEIKVFYNGEEYESYIFIAYDVKFAETLMIDEENKYIKNLTLGTTIGEFVENILVTGGVVHVYDNAGNIKANASLIATGDEVIVYTAGGKTLYEYRLSVLGDSNGDGKMSLTDLAQFRKHLVNWVNPNTGVEFELTGVYSEAFDLNQDGRISILDLAIMRKKIVGLI